MVSFHRRLRRLRVPHTLRKVIFLAGECFVDVGGLIEVAVPERNLSQFTLNFAFSFSCLYFLSASSRVVTSDLQGAIIDDTIENLPEGLFALDHQQQEVVNLQPPLILESRSGTGKTNVLFQHAVAYARKLAIDYEEVNGTATEQAKYLLFVTVSSMLQEELRNRYEEVAKASQSALPEIGFFSLRDLLQYLVDCHAERKRDLSKACSFVHYVFARKSHAKIEIESS